MKKRTGIESIGAILFLVVGVILGYFSVCDFGRATVVVEWETASEMNTAGFNILRSDSDTGPFTQINDQIIPPSADPLTGGSYTFEDRTAEVGKTYFYFLEELETNGEKNQHGPIVQKAQNQKLINIALALILIVAPVIFLGKQLYSRKNQRGNIQ